ncbi:MAG: DUF1499 domain-containing protein [Gammaproteobacteria bacterium]|nr:DUF1499 domain-containing protein [Gammaproteobacteria bacterium]
MPLIKSISCYHLLIITMFLISCSGQRPNNLGIYNGHFSACSSSPNCVSSDAKDLVHKVPPFYIDATTPNLWKLTAQAIQNMPRTQIILQTDDYLHAECTSAFFGFVDDLELHLRTGEGIIAVRSASRLGYSDFGINKKRIDNLNTNLIKLGIAKQFPPTN